VRFDGFPVRGDNSGGGAVAFDDQLVNIGGVESVEGLQREVVDLSRCRDSSIYADTATIPTRVERPGLRAVSGWRLSG